MHLVPYMGTDINLLTKLQSFLDSGHIQPTIVKKLQNLKELRDRGKILLHKILDIQNIDFLQFIYTDKNYSQDWKNDQTVEHFLIYCDLTRLLFIFQSF